jgi:aryl sulfotransferase
MEGEIRKLAAFLDIEIDEGAWPAILEHCSFDYMRERAMEKDDPGLIGGGATFYSKGTNGRWRDVLTADDLARYDAEVARHLTPECAEWLATGRLPH